MRSSWFALSLLLLAAPAMYSQVSPTQPEGRIIGTVLDERGQPIDNAHVSTLVSLRPGETFATEGAKTVNNGQFQIEHLSLGSFTVLASKDEDGYAGFNQAGMPTVTLTPEAPLAKVVVKLGPKEGILAPSVTDKVTGKPVCNFLLRWHVTGTNSSWAGGMGFSRWTTRQSIPAEKDVFIDMVSARGYKKWVPTDPSDPSRPLQLYLQHGEVKSLSIELEPEAKDAQ